MTRTFIIDRFEGGYAICEMETDQKPKKKKDIHFYGIELSELPKGAKEGDVLKVSDDGTLSLDEAATSSEAAK